MKYKLLDIFNPVVVVFSKSQSSSWVQGRLYNTYLFKGVKAKSKLLDLFDRNVVVVIRKSQNRSLMQARLLYNALKEYCEKLQEINIYN